jgi:phosphate transport system substrate-binding protein
MYFQKLILLSLSILIAGAWLPSALSADSIELEGGKTIEGQLYVIKDDYHYFRIHKSTVERVRYSTGPSKPDFLVLKSGIPVSGKVTAFVDDEYFIRIRSGQVRGVTAAQQPIAMKSGSAGRTVAVPPVFGEGVILRIHGSNTVGSKLAPAFAAAYLKKAGASNLEELVVGNEETEVRGYFPGRKNPSVVEIHSHGSATAFSCLEDKRCDMGASSRRIKKAEADKLLSLGDMTGVRNEHVIGLDGIAVIVNKSNLVFRMSREDIKKVFSGEIADWSKIGGNPGHINIYARDDKSGTWDTFNSIVLGKAKLAAAAKRYEDSSALSADVANDINGIGFIGLPYVLDSKALAVSDGAEPVAPDRFSIATEDYPLSRRLYFYTPAGPGSPHVAAFVEFALSEEGQGIVDRTGFVDLNVRLAQPKSARPFSQQYLGLSSGGERLSVNFRFRANSFDLDTKAARDIHRVAKMLKGGKYRGRKVMLFGFTDDIGSVADNRRLSERRALAIKKELGRRGISVMAADVIGFGKLNPVASNVTTEGREKNRRVEIWIK